MTPIQYSRYVVCIFTLGCFVNAAPAAESQGKLAKPGGDKDSAGIIILDGKTPPGADAAGKVSTGIGLGGCAACDKPKLDAKVRGPLKTAAPKVPASVTGDPPAAAK